MGQVTANERFALFFPEKRPFSLEGLEQYDTPNSLIYTRQVVQPLAGAKLIGKIGGTAVAYLGAVDETDSVTREHPIFNVLRLRRDLGASSTIGVVYTDKIEGGDYNRLLGTDARVVWGKLWFSQAQVVGSTTTDAFGHRTGALWDAVFADRTGRRFGNHYELLGITPDFVAASGFVNRTGIVTGNVANRWSWYGGAGAPVEQVTTFLLLNPLWKYDDFIHGRGASEGGISSNWTATLRGGWSLTATVANVMQKFDTASFAGYRVNRGTDTIAFNVPHALHNLWSGNAGFTTPNRALSATFNAGYAEAPIFAEAAEGRQVTVTGEVMWRPTRSLRTDLLWTYQSITRARDGSRYARADIPRLKVEYQLTRAIFVRYVGQYFAQDQAALVDPRTGQPLLVGANTAALLGPPVIHDFRSDVLFSYRPTPGTVFLFGYGATLSEPNAFQFRDLTRESDGFFLKVSYLWRL